jgi:hypothetical protein
MGFDLGGVSSLQGVFGKVLASIGDRQLGHAFTQPLVLLGQLVGLASRSRFGKLQLNELGCQ